MIRLLCVAQMVKNRPAMQETEFYAWVRKIPWRRACQPSPVFLPGEFHGQRSPAGYSPWGRKESDTTEVAYDNTYLYMYSKTLNHSIAEIVTSH